MSDLLRSRDYDLERAIEERDYEKKRTGYLYSELTAQQERTQQLSEELYSVQKEVGISLLPPFAVFF